MSAILLLLLVAPTESSRNPLIDGLAHCLTVPDTDPRLQCLETAARALVDATRSRDVVVVQKDELRRVRRSLFGIDADGPASPAIAQERIDNLDTQIVQASRLADGKWLFRLAEGGRWQTTEPWITGSDPKAGAAVTIRRGALGSYVLHVPGERSARVHRIN